MRQCRWPLTAREKTDLHPANVTAERANRPVAAPLRWAPRPPSPDPYRQEARRRRFKLAIVCGGVLALVALLAVWSVRSAAAHYERGRQALDAERYSEAIQELNAARILAFPYRDADTLAAEAADALNSDMMQEAQRQTRLENAVRAYVRLADTSLRKGDAAATARALASARELVPEGELPGDSSTLALLRGLATRLNDTCRKALAEGRWRTAAVCTQAALLIDPKDAAALRLTAKTRRGAQLQERLDDARAAADRGQWKRALLQATAVLDAWPGFPGAASLVSAAKTALAPKPTPSPTAAPPTTPPAPPPPAPPPP